MNALTSKITNIISTELSLLWAAHKNVGLEGYMCLYTNTEQVPFRSKESGLQFWFNAQENQTAIEEIIKHYNNGHLPNSPLLLNPIIHRKEEDGSYTPIGSGLAWCSALALGVDVLNDFPIERLTGIGAFVSYFQRGGNERSGLKVLAFCNEIQLPEKDGKSVSCCRELYEIADIKSDLYSYAYFLSGISYLTNNGLFEHPDITNLFPHEVDLDASFIEKHTASKKIIKDTAECWNSYDRHHSLYRKFGNNIQNIESNLRFFNMVARDVSLFDATGSARQETENKIDFLVPGLIPRGAVTLLAGAGGTGKSSIAHQLAIFASTDYPEDTEPPKWLGQPIDLTKCTGVNLYFSGEDGLQIFNARAEMLDPENQATRLVFQRTDFGEKVTFAQHIRNLRKIPQVPLLIVDPARKYLVGDENDASVVSDFFDALEDFAIEKNSAVVIVHHLQKGSRPKDSREVIDCLSGSQVFVDRPRVVIGMYRDGAYAVAGLAKNNIPPNLGMVLEERVFARDPNNLSLVWLPGEDGIRNAPLSNAELEEISSKTNDK